MRCVRVAVCFVLLALAGGSASARTSSVTLSIRAVPDQVASNLCTAPYYTCQAQLNPTWSFTADDLRYTTNGLNTSTAPCLALHSDLGEFGPISIASGGDSTAPPPGAPFASGGWRLWCYGFLPKTVSNGDQGISLFLKSPVGKLGTATVDVWLLRSGQLPDFGKATMAHATVKVQFGGGAAPSTTTAASGKLTLDYELPPRFGLHGKDGLPRYTTTRAEISPTSWPVIVEPSSCPPGHQFLFSVDAVFQKPEPLGDCRFLFRFPKQGSYRVSVADVSGGTASTTVDVRDFLIAGLGDSAASGEGVPDVPASGGARARWQSARCDRSALGFQPVAVKAIEDADKHTSVTFVHLACSGAGIASGEVGTYWGIAPGDAKEPLGSQIDELSRLIGKRKLDAILISIGINDLGFGHIVEFCVKHRDCQHTQYAGEETLAQVTNDKLAHLGKDLYPVLAKKLARIAPGVPVLITQYPDPTRDASGRTCAHMVETAGVLSIDANEAEWMTRDVLQPLNRMIAATARRYHWTLVPGAEAGFQRHGYCAEDQRWVVTLADSESTQGDVNGTLHPNVLGHQFIAGLVKPILSRALYPHGKPKPLR
jgi:lysophospholipase L1-like esterase